MNQKRVTIHSKQKHKGSHVPHQCRHSVQQALMCLINARRTPYSCELLVLQVGSAILVVVLSLVKDELQLLSGLVHGVVKEELQLLDILEMGQARRRCCIVEIELKTKTKLKTILRCTHRYTHTHTSK